jgi:hypothetical protein
MVEKRCSRSRDQHLRSFTKRSARDVTKQFKISDLAGMLNRFSNTYKSTFHAAVQNTAAHVAWDNIYNNRQAVAHGSGAQMSFTDLENDYRNSLLVIDALVAALQLRPYEVKNFS